MKQPTAMDAETIQRAIARIAGEIVERARSGPDGAPPPERSELCVVGIRRGGVHLARRLQAEIARTTGVEPALGTLDIALYRDDVGEHGTPVVGATEIRFPVQGKTIVLVDDVLYTGRTVRAALDELVDFGRPRRVWLAVLVDRGGRELPIRADFVGATLEVADADDVEVRLREGGAPEDGVVVTPRMRA